MNETLKHSKEWIKKAENDLIVAKHSLTLKPVAPYDIICFHAQQCAEKYLKAYLVYKGIEFEKTHDLGELIGLASAEDNNFMELIDIAERLTDYAVDVRYPGIEEPTKEEAKEAIEIAEKIKEFILKRLPSK
jgi:HEPN domain-containing protein|uniref:HEPN domain-containing protein n=1 Tax=Caldisericum exile TaxID=693075 RepID=A0A7C4TXN1_9BACT